MYQLAMDHYMRLDPSLLEPLAQILGRSNHAACSGRATAAEISYIKPADEAAFVDAAKGRFLRKAKETGAGPTELSLLGATWEAAFAAKRAL